MVDLELSIFALSLVRIIRSEAAVERIFYPSKNVF